MNALRNIVKNLKPRGQMAVRMMSMEEGGGNQRYPEKTINQVNLMGRLGRDPTVMKENLAFLLVATRRQYTNREGNLIVNTEWHDVITHSPGMIENVITKLRKGDRVVIVGSITSQTIRDQNDAPRKSVKVLANEIINLTKKFQQESQSYEQEEEELESVEQKSDH